MRTRRDVLAGAIAASNAGTTRSVRRANVGSIDNRRESNYLRRGRLTSPVLMIAGITNRGCTLVAWSKPQNTLRVEVRDFSQVLCAQRLTFEKVDRRHIRLVGPVDREHDIVDAERHHSAQKGR
jgi:hypothetical protein